MKFWIPLLIAGASLLTLAGCSMCCGTFDSFYPTYGGRHDRGDRQFGRIGSRFSDPNFDYQGDSADSNLEPVKPDTIHSFDGDELDLDQDGLRQNEGILPPSLPQDPDAADNETTATRRWQNRPLRNARKNWW